MSRQAQDLRARETVSPVTQVLQRLMDEPERALELDIALPCSWWALIHQNSYD